ncbi:helix-turn-helix transcriptional regulator [Mesorhizobium sp. Cs1299R1N3]|uniref:helix-turn-helix transcriptional regulator n=1 Tax=Mesorhizobium sp. Cs1299R1N3 TaxID=3015173 RepID=UPI00301DC904
MGDPLRHRIRRINKQDCVEIITLDELKLAMNDAYKRIFYSVPGIVDKIALLAKQGELLLVVNLYRYLEKGPYTVDERDELHELLKIAARLVLLHYASSKDHTLEDPLLSLSDRERQTCYWILKGLTTEAIAHELDVSPNTVTTYRKRAYEKLSINSKSALFAICR